MCTVINQAISDVSARPWGGVLFFPTGVYLTGTVLMKSNVTLYIDAGALIRGSRKNADYTSASTQAGGRQLRAFIIFNNVENADLRGRGTIDMEGYPWLWHDFQPDTSDGRARDSGGKVNDPRNGVRRYVINNSRNISFQDLLLLRSAYWTVNVFGSENFSTRHIKIVNRKQQYHDDAYDFRSRSHILIEDGFAMTMDDTFALYGGGGGQAGAARGIEDLVVKGFVNYTYTAALAVASAQVSCVGAKGSVWPGLPLRRGAWVAWLERCFWRRLPQPRNATIFFSSSPTISPLTGSANQSDRFAVTATHSSGARCWLVRNERLDYPVWTALTNVNTLPLSSTTTRIADPNLPAPSAFYRFSLRPVQASTNVSTGWKDWD